MSRALLFLQHFPRRRCAWTGYWLVVRPVGWVARARHLCRPREGLPGSDAKKARTFVRALISNMAVRGGIDSLRSPLRGSPLTAFAVCPTGCASCRTPVGGSHPPPTENIKEKSPYFRTSSHLEYGGEGGIRTPDTLPYTHFPGVLLQPLGHLTILSCCSPWVGNGALL